MAGLLEVVISDKAWLVVLERRKFALILLRVSRLLSELVIAMMLPLTQSEFQWHDIRCADRYRIDGWRRMRKLEVHVAKDAVVRVEGGQQG